MTRRVLYRSREFDGRTVIIRDTFDVADAGELIPVRWSDGGHYVESLTDKGWELRPEGFEFSPFDGVRELPRGRSPVPSVPRHDDGA